jgi:thiol-disulfide isomerase/thioredoxin
VSNRWIFSGVGLLALMAGAALWLGTGGPSERPTVDAAPSAIYAASFSGPRGEAHSLGEFGGRIVVLNFWATWCAPCREEMPAFSRLQARWADKGVQFVGLSNEDARRVDQFGRDLNVSYPLWVGGDEVGELSRRLGNRLGVLPYTVLLDRSGNIMDSRVGTYPESMLEERLTRISAK